MSCRGWQSLVAIVVGLVTAAPAAAADFTWIPNAASNQWSNGANWEGGAAPSGTVGALNFGAPHCPTASCGYQATNDVDGLSASTLTMTVAAPGAAGGPSYALQALSGSPLTLSSGLTLDDPNPGIFHLGLPLVLSGPNSWTIAHGAAWVEGGVSGSGSLDVKLTDSTGPGGAPNTIIFQGAANEVGPVSITGTLIGPGGMVSSNAGVGNITGAPGDLNGTNGNPVALKDLLFGGVGRLGALSTSNTTLSIGTGPDQQQSRTLQVASAAFGPKTFLTLGGDYAGTRPGLDFGEITSSGSIDLGGVTLSTSPGVGRPCPAVGTVYTLISTTGALTGAPANPRNQLACGPTDSVTQLTVTFAVNAGSSPRTVTATIGPNQVQTANPGVAGALAQLIDAALATFNPPAGTSIGSLLTKGVALVFDAPAPGALSVSWYLVPAGAHISAKKKPVLVARGSATTKTSGRLKIKLKPTSAGKRLLKKAARAKKRLRLTSRSEFKPLVGSPAKRIAKIQLKR